MTSEERSCALFPGARIEEEKGTVSGMAHVANRSLYRARRNDAVRHGRCDSHVVVNSGAAHRVDTTIHARNHQSIGVEANEHSAHLVVHAAPARAQPPRGRAPDRCAQTRMEQSTRVAGSTRSAHSCIRVGTCTRMITRTGLPPSRPWPSFLCSPFRRTVRCVPRVVP